MEMQLDLLASPPPHNGRDTSRNAAASIAECAASMRDRAYRLIAARPMTCDHLEQLTGWAHQSASARVWELERSGQIQDSGKRAKTRSGRSARVYEVTKTKREYDDGNFTGARF